MLRGLLVLVFVVSQMGVFALPEQITGVFQQKAMIQDALYTFYRFAPKKHEKLSSTFGGRFMIAIARGEVFERRFVSPEDLQGFDDL